MDFTGVIHKKLVVTLVVFMGLLNIPILAEADVNVWKDVESRIKQKSSSQETHQRARYLSLDHQRMSLLLNYPNLSDSILLSRKTPKTLSLPLSNGSSINVSIEPSSIISEDVSKRFNIKVFRVLPDNKVISGRVDFSTSGFHAMLQMRSGETFLIDPKSALGDSKQGALRYISYKKQDQHQTQGNRYSCGVKNSSDVSFDTKNLTKRSADSSEKSLLTYKIAIAASSEYVAKKGGTVEGALSAIVTTLSRVNQVYEQDLGIHLELVDNNDLLIYTDAASDPYTSSDLNELIIQNQNNINTVIGVDNYDIGHLFRTKGGGLSGIGGVCSQGRKAQGVSGISNPTNDSFNLDFVAHEIGHQLGATHTFNGIEGLCSSSARTARTAFEPGSGSTIMSYAGYCGVDNLQSHSDAMFHIGSINQIRDFTTNDRGNRCGIRKQAQNSPPTVNAGKDYIIPAQTPFELIGTASDNDGDELVFTWQQIDSGEQSQPNSDTGDNALFRVHFPSSKRTRSFPPIDNILNHSTQKGEILPIQQRSLNFSFVAQDGFNAAESDEMLISVLRTGSRFALNMPRSSYARGTTHKILWNTANTEKEPINCDAVDIFISHDGGRNFDSQLATAVPNTGESWITIPADFPLINRGRFKLSCSNNIFFALSYRDFIVSKQGEIIPALFNDEDKPELNLSDREIGVINTLNATPPELQQPSGLAQNSGAAGGSFSFLFLYYSMFIFLKRRKFTGTILS